MAFRNLSVRVAKRTFSSTTASRHHAEVVIVAAVRTPTGGIQGSLASLRTVELGSIAIRAAVARSGLSPDQVDEVFMGNVVSAGVGQAPATQAMIGAGLPNTIPSTTINKVCASGMKAIMLGAQSIALGQNDVVVAGGMESMSHVPFYVPGVRTGYAFGHQQLLDGILHDGLTDAYDKCPMGLCTEKVIKDMQLTRQMQDDYAVESYKRALAATQAGRFADEIVPITIKGKKGDVVVSQDDEVSRLNEEKARALRPAFAKDGTITAHNASTLSDGASAVVLMSADKAKALGIKPLARIIGYGDAAGVPAEFGTAPSKAVPRALKMAGVTAGDIQYHEVNEAFSAVVLANAKLLNMDLSRVNVNGGAVALGHPIGSSGSRIVVTLLNVLKQNNATLGCASICNGGGGASAIVIERL